MKRINPVHLLIAALMCWMATSVQAQLLPNNKTLNVQSVTRWMQSNRDLAPVMQVLDGMNTDAEAMARFDALPDEQQDAQIDTYLNSKNILPMAEHLARQHGWKNLGEYMRLSTRLGNAIAAYFTFGQLQNPTEDELKSIREKVDPAILAVPRSDIAFIKANEPLLRAYIQAYGAGK